MYFLSSCLVRSVTLSSINFGRYDSVIYRNLCTVCKLFNWSVHDYKSGRVCLTRRFFTVYYKSRLPADKSTTVSFMYELLKLRDGYLDFSGSIWNCNLDWFCSNCMLSSLSYLYLHYFCLAVCTLYVLLYDVDNNNNNVRLAYCHDMSSLCRLSSVTRLCCDKMTEVRITRFSQK